MKLKYITTGLALLLLASCAREKSAGLNDDAKRYFDAWISRNHPSATRTPLGAYVLEETPGTGIDAASLAYIRVNYTTYTLAGQMQNTTVEKVARQNGNYDETKYYGPIVGYRGDGEIGVPQHPLCLEHPLVEDELAHSDTELFAEYGRRVCSAEADVIGYLGELDLFRQMLFDVRHHLDQPRRVLLLSDYVFHLDSKAVRHAVDEVVEIRKAHRVVEFPDELVPYVVGDHVEKTGLYRNDAHLGRGAYRLVVHLLHRFAVASASVVERCRVLVVLLRKSGDSFVVALCDSFEVCLLARVRKVYLISPRSAEDHVCCFLFAHFTGLFVTKLYYSQQYYSILLPFAIQSMYKSVVHAGCQFSSKEHVCE